MCATKNMLFIFNSKNELFKVSIIFPEKHAKNHWRYGLENARDNK